MTSRSRRARLWRLISSRPHLVAGALAGALAWLALDLAPDFTTGWSTRAILAWDLGAVVFITSMMRDMARGSVERIRATVALQDEGQGIILGLVLIASAASLWTIALELGLAHQAHGWLLVFRVTLAAVTVALSWFVVQLIFALHYRHEFYGRAPDGKDRGGLQFPGGEAPDSWDFVHFAVVIGVAAQTADIAFTSKTQRRIGTMHSLIAFVFNTVVLALTINLLAGLVS